MSSNQDLREAFADDETRQWAASVDHANPACPGCGKAGVPTSSTYVWNWFECVSTDCRTTMFDIEKPAGTGTEPADSVDGGEQ
jgi:ribosomal protein L37AE/L43A